MTLQERAADIRAVLVASGDAEAVAAWDELVAATIGAANTLEANWLKRCAASVRNALRNAGALNRPLDM